MIKAEWIREKIERDEYFFSKHGDAEREKDNLTIAEVEEALLSGRILEQYSDTGRGESCLIAGFSDDGKPVHIVCGSRDNQMVIITVYIPTPPKFKTPFQRG